jgi:hypothetical protein
MVAAQIPGSGPPPADVEPDELWATLSRRERPTMPVEFPGQYGAAPVGELRMWPLHMNEIILAKAEGTRRARKIIVEKVSGTEHVEGYAQVLEDETRCQILYLACRRSKNVTLPVFPRVDDVRNSLTTDEAAVLLNSYAIVQAKLGPIPDFMDRATQDAWIERLKVGGSALPLALLSSDQKNDLIMYLVSQLPNSAEDKSSAGSPPEAPTSTV